MIDWQWIVFGFLMFIFLVAGGITAFIIMNRYRWNFTFEVLENVNGSNIKTRKGRCRIIGFGDGGEEIFFLKGLKKYRAAYGKRTGRNHITWSIGEDGYWYNVTFGNLDKKLLELDIMPVDRDMRYSTASIRKGIENRYNEKNFFEKYGVAITIFLLIVAIVAGGISNYLSLKQINKAVVLNTENNKLNKEVMDLAKQVLSNVATIKTGGTGLIPAT